MELKLLKCDWGMEHLGEMPDRLRAFAKAGYDGVECANIGMDPFEFGDLTAELGLDYVAMMFCDTEADFKTQLEAVKKTRPILVNCHPGRDYFDLDRSVAFFNNVMEMASEIDAPMVFETHRTRCLYSAVADRTHLERAAVAAHHRRLQPLHQRRREQSEGAAVRADDGSSRSIAPTTFMRASAPRTRHKSPTHASAWGCGGPACSNAGGTASSTHD